MVKTYPKATGSAGVKGVDFQVNLLSLFLLNALRQNLKDWRLSTENKFAGKFDDVVLEFDGGAILLQAKHKENRKITLDQLLSTNSKNEDFSLPKYFLSYLDVRTKFPLKLVIVCTNTQTDKVFKCVNQNSMDGESMLHYQGDASFFTFSDRIVSDLITNAKLYHKNNLKGKVADESLITEENAKDFLTHLQFYLGFPSGNDLERATEKLLSGLKYFGDLFHNVSYRDLHQKVKDWFEHPKGEYLTECEAKAMFCEIKSDKHLECLEDYKVSLKNDYFNIMDSKKRIFHVVSGGGGLLHLMKVYHGLKHSKNKILFAGGDYGRDVQKQTIKAFALPLYTHLIIASPDFSEESVISEICVTLRDILESQSYKKIIFVAERHCILVQQMKSTNNDYEVFDDTLTLEDLSEDTQEMLLKKKTVIFQGEDVSLDELFPEQITDDHKKYIKSEILEQLVIGDKFTVGMRFTDLEEEKSMYYVDRKFEKIVNEGEKANDRNTEPPEIISEEDIFSIDDKMILISDDAGMGKSTVLKNLAITVKKNNLRLWVIRIEVNQCTKILRDSLLKNRSINIWDLLNCNNSVQTTNKLEKYLFSFKEMVVLMLDGIDEISPDYTQLILDLLLSCQDSENLKKVFVSTRPHLATKIETHLNVASFKLVPLTEQNQIDFFTRYWTDTLKLEGESTSRCERYANVLIDKVSSCTRKQYSECNTEVKFVDSPLHARILAEVFLENRGSEEWEGCKEYLKEDEAEPKLPERMNVAQLYDMFVERKRDIFIDKGNPSANTMADQALKNQFEECLAYHRSLALKAILNEQECEFFSCYKRDVSDDDETTALKMGIIQKASDDLIFAHRTFAEYFVAKSILKELQLRNPNVGFQRLLIDEVFLIERFEMVRRYLDNLLHDCITSLPCNIFDSYTSLVIDTDNSSNLIHQLAHEGNSEIIRFVLKLIDFKIIRDRKVSFTNFKRFFKKKNTLNILKSLVKRDGINVMSSVGSIPLHRAVTGGHLDTVKFLVDMGADINGIYDRAMKIGRFKYLEMSSDTALCLAVMNCRLDIVEYLVEKGADVNVVNHSGLVALHFAILNCSYDTVVFLVEHGADVNIVDKEGDTPLHLAAIHGSLDIVEFFVKHCTNINTTNREGYTPLSYAARENRFNVVEFLVKHGADVNTAGTDDEGKTALHFAANFASFEVVEFLVEHGADIHAVDKEGNTALHYATYLGNRNRVAFLVERHANINYVNRAGNTALHNAVGRGNFDTVKFLVDHGADINAVDRKGNSVVHFAVEGGNLEIVELFMQRGADINVRGEEGDTALHLAVKGDKLSIVEYLVEHGADINIANKKGHTALSCACMDEYLADIKRFLLEQHADVNAASKNGLVRKLWNIFR